ncbi:MAG TPA: 2-C-methyl-D-erythritol 4-phosphate cytidylyltransferase [Thermoanaerobaculia bacterium]|nr:2-C-methyl-D-erythritol 4-phosphate cytidylyltransferase [Thermoanaerobaculia bacterium]
MADAERVLVIIPAAGSGTRFGGDVPKQFQPLGGKPLVQRAVERFLFDAVVTRVVVPVMEKLVDAVKSSPGERVTFVAGGATRLQSVTRGLEASGGEFDLIAIHDAVRPFFSLDTFHATLDAAREHGAAFPGISLPDTVHQIANEAIAKTLDRSVLVAAQTPQCFRADVLRDILARAAREDADATDEAGLAAKYGHHVHLVPGDSMNFKITRPEDLVMAERIWAEWGGEGDA